MRNDSGPVSEPYEGELVVLAALKVVLNVAHKLGLFKSTFTPTVSNVWADFDAAKSDFGGYAEQDVVITGSPGVTSDGVPQLPVDQVDFVSDDGDPPDTVSGWYIYDNASVPKRVKYYGQFNQPIAVNQPLQQLHLSVDIREAGVSTWSLES